MPAKRRKPAARTRKPKPEPRFIEGIHHYCDRWCERCEFSHRCIKFTLTEELCGEGAAMRDGASQTVFDALSRVFTEARIEIERAAKKLGTDDEATLAACVAVEKRLQRQALRTGSRETKAALTYAHMADEWFNNELKLPLQRVRDLERRVHQGLVSVASGKSAWSAVHASMLLSSAMSATLAEPSESSGPFCPSSVSSTRELKARQSFT